MELGPSLLSAVGVIAFAVAFTSMLARWLRIPAILLYLLVGVIAGRAVLGFVDPEELEAVFEPTLELLVALIVFEGAFLIDTGYLQRVGGVVRNLLTLGLAITLLSATALAGLLDVLPWRTAVIFGALVVVTGPTVIIPIIRRVRLSERVRAVLLGEGVLIDPLGAVLAVVVLDLVFSGLHADPLIWGPTRLAGGFALGLTGALLLQLVIRFSGRVVPSEMNLLLLGGSAALYAFAEAVLDGSGLAAMATVGVALSALQVPYAEDVRSFEDDLSHVLLGGVYILAAATVDLDVLADLWPFGLLVVLALMFVVRPLTVFLSALGSDLTWAERAYISLIGPRGVVAISLAALTGAQLPEDLEGSTLTALVFLTVSLTVAIQSSYAGPLARWLGVRSMRAIIGGAGPVARRLSSQLRAGGFDVLLVDVDPAAIEEAVEEGHEAEVGDITDTKLLERLRADEVQLVVAVTDSDQANLLFCQYALTANPKASAFAIVHQPGAADAFRRSGIHVVSRIDALSDTMMDMIGAPVLYDALSAGADNRVTIELPVGSGIDGRRIRELRLPERALVLLVRRGETEIVPSGNTIVRRGDRMLVFGSADAVRVARERLVSIE